MTEQHFLRSFPAKPFVAARAINHEVWTDEGQRLLDFGGASHGVNLLGHNHPAIVEAIREQSSQLVHVAQGIPCAQRAQALELLHGFLPNALTKTFLANSGAEANELALKLAVAKTGRGRFTAMERSFHGRTLATASLTHRPAFREPFAPAGLAVDFSPWDVDALAENVHADTAAIIMEPIQGEGGIRVASPALLRAARDLAEDHGAVLIFDEIQCGTGRTGTFLACEQAGVLPDVVTIGKGLAGGLPIGATIMQQEIADSLPPGGHGSTYGGSPMVCAAMAATLRTLQDVLPSVAEKGHAFSSQLSHPAIKEISGAGLMLGASLRVRPQPVLAAMQERGLLALAAGTREVRFLPPLTTPAEALEEAARIIVDSL